MASFKKIELPWTDGLEYKIPEPKQDEDIFGREFPKKEQLWRRIPTPNFLLFSEEEKNRFFETELERIITGVHFMNNGKVEWITGNHYWFLQHWNLGGAAYPRFMWHQKIIGYFLDLCRKDNDCFGAEIIASKRLGKTEFIPCEFLSDSMLQEIATYIMQAQNDIKSKKVFRRTLRAFQAMKRSLPYTYQHITTQNEIMFRNALAAKKTTKKANKDDISESDHVQIGAYPSKIDFIQGETTRGIFCDEFASQEQMDMVEWFDTAIAQCSEGIGKKIVGKIWLIATPERAKSKSLPFAEKLYEESNPQKRNSNGRTVSGLYRMLIPFYESTPDFIDKYGYSNVEEAKKFFANMCEDKKPQAVRELKRKYITCKEDAFSIISGAVLEADVRLILEHAKLHSEGYVFRNVEMYMINDKVHHRPIHKDIDTGIKIIEPIQKNTKYSLGIDSASTDNETGSDDGSKIGAVITKGFGEGDVSKCFTPVITYSERADNKEVCYHKIYLMAKHVIDEGGELEIIGEINGAGADCFHYLCNRGLRGYMNGTPKEFSNTDAGLKNGKYWIYVGEDVLSFLHGLMNRFIRMYGENFRALSVINSLLKYGSSNQDEASAFIISLMNFRNFDKPAEPKQIIKRTVPQIIFKGGKSHMVWKEIIQDPDNIRKKNIDLGEFRKTNA